MGWGDPFASGFRGALLSAVWNSHHIDGIPAERKMNRTADLDAALRFVIGRIEQEAARSEESLSDENLTGKLAASASQ
jgi:hypothetical protein